MSAYLRLLAVPGARAWLAVTITTRLTVAGVPLGAVFLAKETVGSYTAGAVLAGVFAAGEAVGAPRMGARFSHRPFHGELRTVLCLEALLLLAMVAAMVQEWVPAAAVAVGLAGVVSAGAPVV